MRFKHVRLIGTRFADFIMARGLVRRTFRGRTHDRTRPHVAKSDSPCIQAVVHTCPAQRRFIADLGRVGLDLRDPRFDQAGHGFGFRYGQPYVQEKKFRHGALVGNGTIPSGKLPVFRRKLCPGPSEFAGEPDGVPAAFVWSR